MAKKHTFFTVLKKVYDLFHYSAFCQQGQGKSRRILRIPVILSHKKVSLLEMLRSIRNDRANYLHGHSVSVICSSRKPMKRVHVSSGSSFTKLPSKTLPSG
jgi:hypothetical protein